MSGKSMKKIASELNLMNIKTKLTTTTSQV
ncbi:MAG TPA: hypothetical protein VEY70_16580 [Metabacillus sp.]|nr:hypothetical protein [Metabacillus sp.]